MKYLRVVKAEIKFEVLLYFQNVSAVVTDMVVFFVLFFSLIFLNSGMSLAQTYDMETEYAKILMFSGYLIWSFSSRALSCVSSEIDFEASHGYLLYKLTGIMPIQLLYLCKFIGAIFCQIIIMTPIILYSLFFLPFPSISVSTIFAVVALSAVTLLGMYGVGLVLASLTIYERRLSRIATLFSTIFLFTGNTITYNNEVGKVLKYFPLNFGVDGVRSLIAGKSLPPKDFAIFASICLLFFMVGIALFQFSKTKAKQKGKILWY